MKSSLLNNLKIIDLSTVLAGPSVATFFAELGAEVIKIENKKFGDVTRAWKLPSEVELTPPRRVAEDKFATVILA